MVRDIGHERIIDPDVVVGAILGGDGHDRALLAIRDAFDARIPVSNTDLIKVESYNPGIHGHVISKAYNKAINMGLGILYTKFPVQFMEFTLQHMHKGMGLVNRLGEMADMGRFDSDLASTTKVVIATHPIIADISNKVPTVLCALDPMAAMYMPRDKRVIMLTTDHGSGSDVKNYGENPVVVTGPFLARPIVEARRLLEQENHARIRELRNGAKLRVTIATELGSNAEEIIGLTRAYAEAMKRGEPLEKLTVVAGESGKIKKGISAILKNLPEEIRKRIVLIDEKDQVKRIRQVDLAISESDVLHSVNDELVYDVAKGLAFESFSHLPSRSAQEELLAGYVREKTMNSYGVSALETGKDHPVIEVENIFAQYRSGRLMDRIEAGLAIPVDGADIAVNLAAELLKQQRIAEGAGIVNEVESGQAVLIGEGVPAE